MPISKDGKLYYTEEQFQKARYDSSALEYARAQGYDLVPKGQYHTMREHDSMVFTDRGMWFWNSHNLKGGAIEFITMYEHRTFVEAVCILAGEDITKHKSVDAITQAGGKAMEDTITAYQDAMNRRASDGPPAADTEKKAFTLPERNDNHRRVYAYLTQTRGIDGEIVGTMLKRGILYETKAYHNAAFVFHNNADEAVGAFLRGTTTTKDEAPFRGMAKNSDRENGYFSFGKKASTVACVFEAAIDAMSYATLQKLNGNTEWAGRYYVASGGTGDSNILAFLQGHPEVETVILCHDNDKAGHLLAESLGDKLRTMNYNVSRATPQGKDFNDDLLAITNAQTQAPKEAAAVANGNTQQIPEEFDASLVME